jgi:hypothetical protein
VSDLRIHDLSFLLSTYDCDFSAERDISQKEKKRQNIHGTKPMNPMEAHGLFKTWRIRP